ncbi:hypothetical protein D1872_241640 [compost metagenome]
MDAPGLLQHFRHTLQRLLGDHRGGVDDQLVVIERQSVDGRDFAAFFFTRLHFPVKRILGDRDLEIVKALKPDLFAKTVDACLRNADLIGKRRNRMLGNKFGMMNDELSDLVFAVGKLLFERNDFCNHRGYLRSHDMSSCILRFNRSEETIYRSKRFTYYSIWSPLSPKIFFHFFTFSTNRSISIRSVCMRYILSSKLGR